MPTAADTIIEPLAAADASRELPNPGRPAAFEGYEQQLERLKAEGGVRHQL